MKYSIIVDSCCDLPDHLNNDPRIQKAALSMHFETFTVRDDETFDQLDFLQKVKESPTCPKSSCPSPEDYLECYKADAENIFVVTLSEQLSGSFNSAQVAKNLYFEEVGKKNIHVFNSCSASVGETQIAMKILELAEQGLEFEAIVEQVENFRKETKTYFVIETLETLRKNGRLSNLQAIIASALNIKPVMGATPEGTICKLDQARGIDKALKKMVEIVVEKTNNTDSKILAISHCNCAERAKFVVEEFKKKAKFKDIIITDMGGISSLYANDGGIIVAI